MSLLEGYNLRVIQDQQCSSEEQFHLSSLEAPATVGFINQHGFNLIKESHSVADAFSDLDYLYRDGIGMKLALKIFGQDYGLNMNGTDFIPELCARFIEINPDCLMYCFGTEEPWLSSGAYSLLNTNRVCILDGFQSDSSYLEAISDAGVSGNATLIVLAMGMPKQERIAKLLKRGLKGRCLIVCGGAILDFQAGKVMRAPKLFQTFGLEWLYRLINEPARMFHRYVIGIPKFFGYVLAQKWRSG